VSGERVKEYRPKEDYKKNISRNYYIRTNSNIKKAHSADGLALRQ
jgi:hypothetical protein